MATRTIVFEKQFGGWIPTPEGSVPHGSGLEGRENQYTDSVSVNLFRRGYLGDIAPGEMFQDMAGGTNNINALPLNGVVASNGEAFVVLANSRVVQFGVGDDIIDGTDVVGTSVATTNDNDIEIFEDGNGTEWVAWTWEHSVDNTADIVRMKSDGTNQDDDWFSTLSGSGKLTKGVPHKIKLGPDRIFYCTNERYIASHDPRGSSGNTQALDLGPGWVSTALEVYGIYLAIAARKATTYITSFSASETKLFLWDGFKSTPDFVYDLGDYNVTGLKNDNGTLSIFTNGKNNTTKVKVLSGNEIVTVIERADIGNPPLAKSIETFKGGIVWGQNSGNFLISGAWKTDNGFAHHQAMHPYPTTASIAAIGLLKNLSTSVLYAGVTVAGNSTITKINDSSYFTNADWFSRHVRLPYLSRITKIKFYLSQFGTGASFTAGMFENYDSATIGGANDLLNRQFTQATWGSVDEISVPVYFPNLSSFSVGVLFDHASSTNTAAIIKRIEVEYEPMSISAP